MAGDQFLDIDVADSLRKSKIPVAYLQVSISQAAPRVGFNKERPLLTINPRQQWMALMEVRKPIYEGLATMQVSTDNRKPAEVAQEIVDKLASVL